MEFKNGYYFEDRRTSCGNDTPGLEPNHQLPDNNLKEDQRDTAPSPGKDDSINSLLENLCNDSRKQVRALRKFIEQFSSISDVILQELRDLKSRGNDSKGKADLILRQVKKEAVLPFLENLLDVRDALKRNIERAQSHINHLSPIKKMFVGKEILEALIEGQSLALARLNDCLLENGVREIKAKGKPFDPRLMHAVATEKNDSVPEGAVTEVLRNGYMVEDKVLRYADVKVSTLHKS